MIDDRRGRFRGWMVLLACVASAVFFATGLLPRGSHADTSIGGGRGPGPSGQTPSGQPGGAVRSGAGAPAQTSPGPPRGGTAPGAPALTTTPVPVLPAPKKPIQINPALINSLYHMLLKTDLSAEAKELRDAWEEGGVGLKWRLNSVSSTLPYYQAGVKSCEKRQYTTEDQKNAGCLGTDTLDQCSIKLFNHCFSKSIGNSSFLNAKKNMLEAADRLDKALKAYTVKLKMIPDPPK